MIPATPKKRGPLFWILIAFGIIVLAGGTIFGVGAYFVYRAAERAGVSVDLFQKNPALATAKLAISMNPDLEAVAIDQDTGEITVRSKSSGRIVKMRVDPKTKALQIADLVEIPLPGWVEAYPGTAPKATITTKNAETESTTFTFETKDGPQKVLDFYGDRAAKAGLEVSSKSTTEAGGMLLAEDRSSKRQLVVTVSAGGNVVMSISQGK